MSARSEPVQICLWAKSWWLVGNGPSYLLFRAEEGRVMHLTTSIPRKLRHALKGFSAIQKGKLEPLVRALTRINTAVLVQLELNDGPYTEDAIRAKVASFTVLKEIECLVCKLPDEKIFKGQLARFASQLRAARRFIMEHEREYQVLMDEERSKFWFSDCHGRESLISDCFDSPGPKRVFRCEPDSLFARCAQELWHKEGARLRDRATVLYRVPTRKELREYLCSDEPTITKLCRAEGFDWLPRSFKPKNPRKDPESRGRWGSRAAAARLTDPA
jgi:hypothetical protein